MGVPLRTTAPQISVESALTTSCLESATHLGASGLQRFGQDLYTAFEAPLFSFLLGLTASVETSPPFSSSPSQWECRFLSTF